VMSAGQKKVDEMAADEAGGAGDEDAFGQR
jgi:hypothetical protein